jgi:hypothetical protein
MTPNQRLFAIVASALTLLGVLELVRRRKLREEYSLLWVLTAVGMLVLSSWYGLIGWLTGLIGAVTPTTTLFLFALLFLLLISIHFSTVLSRLAQQVRRTAQELAVLRAELQMARRDRGEPGAGLSEEPPPGEPPPPRP